MLPGNNLVCRLDKFHVFRFILFLMGIDASWTIEIVLIGNKSIVLHKLSALKNYLSIVLELVLTVKTLAFWEFGGIDLAYQIAMQLLVLIFSHIRVVFILLSLLKIICLQSLVMLNLLINFFDIRFIDFWLDFIIAIVSVFLILLALLESLFEDLVVLECFKLLHVLFVFGMRNLLLWNLVVLRVEQLFSFCVGFQGAEKTLGVAFDLLAELFDILDQIDLVVHVFLSVFKWRLEFCYWHL